VLDGVQEERVFAGLNVRRRYQFLPVELARLHVGLEGILPHSDLRRQLPFLVGQGTLYQLQGRGVVAANSQVPSVVGRRVWLESDQLLLRYRVHLFYFT